MRYILAVLLFCGSCFAGDDIDELYQVFVWPGQEHKVKDDDKDDASFILRIEVAGENIGIGTAFIFAKDELLTCAHCVNFSPDEELYIKTKDGWMLCEKEAVDEDIDVCLLKCKSSLPPPPIELDDSVHETGNGKIYGCPHKTFKECFDANCIAPDKIDSLVHCPNVTYGNSGGPLVMDHKIIGMVYSMKMRRHKPTGDVYYVNTKVILDWLKTVREKSDKSAAPVEVKVGEPGQYLQSGGSK